MVDRKASSKPFLSLIVPAYKQEKTIVSDILRITRTLDQMVYRYEVIVVVDGEMDRTFERVKRLASRRVKVVGYQKNRGKGYAVRYGMANAKGNMIAFLDAGMDIDPTSLSLLLDTFIWKQADIVIGSKLHPDSKVHYPVPRLIISWGYRTLTKLLFGLSIRDTQVGLKVFRRNVLEDVLPRLLVKTYAFDIEILAVANASGYRRIYESPIQLDFTGASSVTSKNFWRIILFMLRDTLAVFYRLRILHYYDPSNRRKWRYDPELNFRINLP